MQRLVLAAGLALTACGTPTSRPAPTAAASESAPVSCVERVKALAQPPRRNDPSQPQPQLPTRMLTVADTLVTAELADTPKKRAAGLMLRDHLDTDAGMLFVYPDARRRSFWMHHTCLPLSIAYIGQDGVIVSISDMTPLDESPVLSEGDAMFALEMTQGWFAAHGVSKGARVLGLPNPAAK